jgi:hypothetical protein
MQMRRGVLVVAAVATAVLPLSLAAAAQAAPTTAKVDVLTIGKAGGHNVAAKAVLSAGLAPKTTLTFGNANLGLRCKESTITVKVVSNPAKGHSASLSLTKQTLAKCTITGNLAADVTKFSASITKLPYKVSISDKKGDPVTASGATFSVKATALGMNVTCVFTAKTIKGSASNKNQSVSFSKQKFLLDQSVSTSLCTDAGLSGVLSASFGPVKDTSVKGKPHVYVN